MSNLPATPSNLLAALQNVNSTARQAAGPVEGIQFGKFAKGEWVFGADDLPIEDGSLWAVNPMSISQGFQAWVDGDLAGEQMATMFETPIVRSSLPEVDTTGTNNNGWQPIIGFTMVCLDGTDKGTQMEFKTSSKGGIKACSELIGSILTQVGADPDKPMPVVTLGSDDYKHKKYGKIYTPVIDIKKWIALEETSPTEAAKIESAAEESADEEEGAPAPTRRRRRA